MLKKSLLILFFGLTCILFLNQTGNARSFFGRTVQLPLQKIAPGVGQIQINFVLPKNHEFAKDAPSTVYVRTKHPEILKTPQTKPEPMNLAALPASINYLSNSGETVVAIDLRVYFCDEVTKVCLFDFIRLKFSVQIETGAPAKLHFNIPLKSKMTT